jgi:hypothetical protein
MRKGYDPALRSQRVERSFALLEPRCYKGAFPAGDTVTYVSHSPRVLATDATVADGEVSLFFLKRTGPRNWEFSDAHFGQMRDAFIPTRGELVGFGLGQLERDIVSSLRAGGMLPEQIAGDLRLLHGFDRLSTETLDLVHNFSKDPNPAVAAGAFSVLVKAGSPDDLSGFCSYLNASDETAHLSEFGFSSIQDVRSPSARASLECLARTPNPEIRLAAMEAIRVIASPASVPELVRHLDDTDPTMQYLAVISLSEIARRPGEVGPAMPTFDRDPLSFIISWKKWWNETGRLKYAGAER